MSLDFRNVSASADDPVASWPYEALVIAIERGLVPDWAPIFAEIRAHPWGEVAARLETYLSYAEPSGIVKVFQLALDSARETASGDPAPT